MQNSMVMFFFSALDFFCKFCLKNRFCTLVLTDKTPCSLFAETWSQWLHSANIQNDKNFKKNFIAPFYGWGSTASRLQPLRRGSYARCNISSQDVSKFTYLTLNKYISDEKCTKATSYIVSINSLVWYNYSNYNIYKFTVNIFNIIALGNSIPSSGK